MRSRVRFPASVLPSREIGTLHFSAIVNLTYNQLFTFMGTFSNEELNDAQIIAEHHSKGQNYNQVLINVLVEMREHKLQTHDPMPELIWPELYS